MSSVAAVWAVLGVACVSAVGVSACTSDSGSDTTVPPAVGGVGGTSSAGTGGGAGTTSGGSAGTSAGAGGGSGTAGTSSGGAGHGGAAATGGSAGASAGTGGSNGGTGGASAGTGGASGGTGGASDGCVDPSEYASALKLSIGLPFCVIGAYSTDRSVEGSAPSWGTHGGPLSGNSTATSGVSICRWQLPTGATGAATCEQHDAALPADIPAGVFFGPALDVPFATGTIISYTAMGTNAPGEVLQFSNALDKVTARGNANGFTFAAPVTVGSTSALIYTGLSPITAAASTTNDSGVYVALPCMGSVIPSGTCPAPTKAASWQMSSGPVAVDSEGSVFADLSTFGGSQEIHGFASGALTSATPGDGATVLTDMNFTGSMAATPPSVTKEEGWLFIAESDATTFAAVPLFAVKYGSGGSITPGATVTGSITTVPAMAAPALFSDDKGHVWIAVDDTMTTSMLLELKHK